MDQADRPAAGYGGGVNDLLAEIRARVADADRNPVRAQSGSAVADRRELLRMLDETAGRLPIEELGLDARAYNVLLTSGISHVEELLRMTEDDVTDLRNAGVKTLENVKDRLRVEFGLTLRQGDSS